MSQTPSSSHSSGGHQPDHALDRLLESRLAVLCILFFVTGALGLPLLWLSRRFSWLERLFWAVVVTIYTIVLIGLVAIVLRWSYHQIM